MCAFIRVHLLAKRLLALGVHVVHVRWTGKITKTKHKWHKVVGGQELMTTGLTVQVYMTKTIGIYAADLKLTNAPDFRWPLMH